jgi:CTP synthase (UTP-ammonia lyase)
VGSEAAEPVRIGLIGDHDESVVAHRAIPEALRLALAAEGLTGRWTWVHTTSLDPDPAARVQGFHGLWCVPASPYASTTGALGAIRCAREGGRPFLGTCGGFQHALLEYAAAVWGIDRPAHAETDPAAPDPVISPLACALVDQRGAIRFAPGSRVAASYGRGESVEAYHCRYGLAPALAPRLADGPLRATGWDAAGEVRAVELDGHPFFVATLFQPERAALTGEAPPLVRAFVRAAAKART